ncbi:MAG: UDP-N-acetylmuramoylalanyl-D-glutamyl-2, 6-diaminopimelate--D-alanyl-D-alanine ligase [Desulfovibrio sp. MES5]|uniref:UDP-N-acetylmuramoyl-tripeptide--D-alanyl-D- alanine ligase n=1 Tax=Desulfovibrio sp. MES5 TaxID=1899016 RepID=UPI000B9CC256|nr:UDP-N-acetylmuramoyl-tripeptide--D-alanyl-D-alanine ligase [Desulfovibrio sp. MES5]OXS27851.1 MAG: UDP-N-acetylmuramoylalanyl-D-glutamyl-2, 6-diaminopimelate--D-alanyl-D-alanine ligase [Desulfovibrio sp. MES5]
MRLTIQEVASCLGLPRFSGPEEHIVLTSVATDSRAVVPGSLFVCVSGCRVDGHDFAAKAVEQGAGAVLASCPLPHVAAPVFVVPDTVKALGCLAALWRDRTKARVVGVTGTAGKTTVKETLARILSLAGKTARNAMNNNNQIGMPRSVLNTDGDEDFWVMEAGISQPGDMDDLGAVLRPDLALVLNAGAAHTEGLGEKGVAWHKARLLSYLAKGGKGLVSADYPDLAREARATGADIRFFSAAGQDAAFRASYLGAAPVAVGEGAVSEDGTGKDVSLAASRGKYHLWLDGTELDVIAPFRGEYGAENVAAVAAAAHMLGVDASIIAQGLADAKMPAQRFNQVQAGSWLLIDDTYNANPLSMRRMLEAAAEQAGSRPFVAVLGAMLELGEQAALEHEELGRHLARLNPAAVIWKGSHAEDVRKGLDMAGYAGIWQPVADADDFAKVWRAVQSQGLEASASTSGGVALFKGSRSNKLETLMAVLTNGCEQ